VASFNRPGGNLTGVSQLSGTLATKRLELLHNLVPRASVIAVLADPRGATIEDQLTSLREAARVLDLHLLVETINGDDLYSAMASLSQQQPQALFITATSFLSVRYKQIAALAARYKLPASHEFHEFANAGGLTSYGTDSSDVYRQLGVYTGQILKGSNPAEMPVMQPTKFIFTIIGVPTLIE